VEESDGEKKQGGRGAAEVWRVFCSAFAVSFGRFNRDKKSAVDVWYEAGNWIQTFIIVQEPLMGQDHLIVEASR
jgi:hypothetical protein